MDKKTSFNDQFELASLKDGCESVDWDLISKLQKLCMLRVEQCELILSYLEGRINSDGGPCTIIRVTDFICNKGKIKSIFHLGHSTISDRTRRMWEGFIKVMNNPIDVGLNKISQRLDKEYGCHTYEEVLEEVRYEKNRSRFNDLFLKIKDKVKSGPALYLWVKMASNDIWGIAIRRKKGSEPFSERDKIFSMIFLDSIFKAKKLWYYPKLDLLSPVHQEVVHYASNNYTREQISELTCKSRSAIDKRIEKIFEIFGSNKLSSVIQEIRST